MSRESLIRGLEHSKDKGGSRKLLDALRNLPFILPGLNVGNKSSHDKDKEKDKDKEDGKDREQKSNKAPVISERTKEFKSRFVDIVDIMCLHKTM